MKEFNSIVSAIKHMMDGGQIRDEDDKIFRILDDQIQCLCLNDPSDVWDDYNINTNAIYFEHKVEIPIDQLFKKLNDLDAFGNMDLLVERLEERMDYNTNDEWLEYYLGDEGTFVDALHEVLG